MDAVEFLKTAERRYKSNPHDYANYIQLCGNDFGAYVDELEKWSKEHPRKTRQSVFLAQWPNCMVDNDGTVGMCPRNVDKNYICDISRFAGCLDCRRWFWMQEVE